MVKKNQTHSPVESGMQKVRIDKWLWAARFYKTRSLASDAVKNGKILINGDKVKPSRDVQIDENITIKLGFYTKTVEVKALSERRGPATIAQQLYSELAQSIEQRENMVFMRKAQPGLRPSGLGRPTKKERRQIIQFTEKPSDSTD